MVCFHESLVACNIKTVYSYRGYRHDIVSYYVCANCHKSIPLCKYMEYLSITNQKNKYHRNNQKIKKYFNTFDVILEDDKSKEKIE